MRKQSSIKTILALLTASAAALCAAGCRAPVREILLGEWLGLIVSETGITSYAEEAPYYFGIDESSVYYDAVQSAAGWGIIGTDTVPDPSAALTREWTAYTLVNLAGIRSGNTVSFRDRNASQFPEQISSAVASGLMKTDRHNRFHPKEVIDGDEARILLEETIRYMNERKPEAAGGEMVLQEDVIPEVPESLDTESGRALFASGSQVYEGAVFATGNDEIPYAEAEVVRVSEDGETEVQWKEADAEDVISDLDLSGSFELDFSRAEIIDLLNPEIPQESSASDPAFTLMRMRPLQKSTQIRGWNISYGITASGLKASAVKTAASGIQVSAEAELSGVRPVYEWHMHAGKIDNAYFRIDCITSQSLRAKRSAQKQLRADGGKIDPKDFMNSLKAAFSETDDTADLSVPLCTIRIPVPEMPVVSIVCRIELNLKADGRAEISLSQNHSLGMEIRNGMMRPIHETQKKQNALMHASASMTSDIMFAMEAGKLRLCDCGAEAGVRGTLVSTVHAYDAQNSHSAMTTSMPADLVAECAAGAADILVCSDIRGGWILNLNLNSGSSFAGKMGFGASLPILSESNAPLVPGMKTHMENFHFVDHCTRGSRSAPLKKEEVPDGEQISVDSYALIGNAGETLNIKVTELPEAYSPGSLIYQSSDPLTVAVLNDGTLQLNREGSAVITISTNDGKYRVKCTVAVRHEEKHDTHTDQLRQMQNTAAQGRYMQNQCA